MARFPRVRFVLPLLLVSCHSTSIDPREFDYYSKHPAGTAGAAAVVDANPAFAQPVGPDFLGSPASGATDAGLGTSIGRPTRVRVQAGDSLYGLSRRHLGSGQRWREIAELNGFSQADISRLVIGREIKIPPR